MARFTKLASIVAFCISAAILLSNTGCHKAKDPWESVEGGKTKVLVSFPPLYCFTKAVADKDAKVYSLIDLQGPHNYQPGTVDNQYADGADLILINGLGLDEFVTKIGGKKKATPVEIAESFSEKKRLRMGDHGHDHDHDKDSDKGKDKGHDHDHGEWDPHAWLGIEQAILMVNAIRDELKKADPPHAADYDRRAAEYVKKLEKLQEDGKRMLAEKKNRKLIAMHDSLGYFCKSFDLEMVDSIMPRPGVEADLKKLAELSKECEDKKIFILAVEPQYSKDKATTLRDNLKGSKHEIAIVEIDPLETGPRGELGPDYYLKVMNKNLENLAKHMQ